MTTSRLIFPLCLVLTGCSFGPDIKGVRPDPAAIRTIHLQIAPEHLGAAGDSKRVAEMAERVAKNLGTWGYAISADGRNDSHIMEARIGTVEHKSTPTGFSFSIGNSDPRALDFQKADVLPVDCVLYAAGRPKDKASMYMDFVAGDSLKTAGAAKLMDIYVEHMATVCFNLLDDLKAPRQLPTAAAATSGGGVATPAWMPEVRVEIRDKPSAATTPAPAVAPTPTPAVSIPIPAPNTPKATAAPAPAPAATETPPPVTTETKQGESRKQMIIHNQGSPIILEFGYERK